MHIREQRRSLAMVYDALAKKPQIHDIDPAIVESLKQKTISARNGKLPSNGPIDKIKRYDWMKDKKGYQDENGLPPVNRCFHCGYQYNNATGFSAFCNICTKALKYMEGGTLTKAEQMRTRVPDGRKPTSLVEVNSI